MMLAAAAMISPLLAWPVVTAWWLRRAAGPAGQGGQLAGLGVVQVVPFFLDAADQVNLVVHGQAEEHGEQEDRDERVDRPGPGQPEDGAAPVACQNSYRASDLSF
jgi:hypothetical protein